MSAIIKSGNITDLSTVRPIGALRSIAPTAAISRHDEELDRLRRRIAELDGGLRQRDEAIGVLRTDVDRAFKEGKTEGHAEGHKAGLAEAEDRQSERLSLLENAMQRAHAELADGLSSLERLSALLAQECLDKILGSPDDRVELLRLIIGTQIDKIDKAMLVDIELSRQDFPDDNALAALKEKIDASAFTLTVSADMPSGGCVMRLRLGRTDVGINQQWGVLRNLLTEMALPAQEAV